MHCMHGCLRDQPGNSWWLTVSPCCLLSTSSRGCNLSPVWLIWWGRQCKHWPWWIDLLQSLDFTFMHIPTCSIDSTYPWESYTSRFESTLNFSLQIAQRISLSHPTKKAFVPSLIAREGSFPQVTTAYVSWSYAGPCCSYLAFFQCHGMSCSDWKLEFHPMLGHQWSFCSQACSKVMCLWITRKGIADSPPLVETGN